VLIVQPLIVIVLAELVAAPGPVLVELDTEPPPA
jgi:hypothetical protein